jgi:hypothetical protein
VDAAIATVDQALAAARGLPEGVYEPELHRLRALALAGTSAPDRQRAIVDALGRAVSIARAQHAALFERRAVATLNSLTMTDLPLPAAADVLADPIVK